MFGGKRQGQTNTNFVPAPTLGQTFTASLEKPVEQTGQFFEYLFPGKSTKQTMEESSNRIAVMDEMLADHRQGIGQKSLNAVGSLIGSMVPGLALATIGGAIGSGVAGAIGFGARALASAAIAGEASEGVATAYLASQIPLATMAEGALGHFLPKASAAAIAGGTLEAFAGYKAFTMPEHFSENYNSVNQAFDASHAIEDWGADNYGFLLAGAPLAAGYIAVKGIKGVIAMRSAGKSAAAMELEAARLYKDHKAVLENNRIVEGEKQAKEAKVSELQNHLQQAVDDGLISQSMHDWYLDYLENPNHPDIHKSGLEVLKELQIPYDRMTGRVWNEVMTRKGSKDFKGALYGQAVTELSEQDKNLLSSYVINNQLDGMLANMRDNPNLLMAMDGMTKDITSKIEAHAREVKNLDYAFSNALPKNVRQLNIFSQKSIYDHLKKIGVRDASEVPYTMPEGMAYKLKLLNKMERRTSSMNAAQRRLFKAQVLDPLKEELKSIKLLTPKEELEKIRGTIIKDKDGKLSLVPGFKNKKAYHRLEDLSQVQPEAKVLLDMIQMLDMNAKQSGMNNALARFIEMADEGVSNRADPKKLKKYLETQMENAVPRAAELKDFRFTAKDIDRMAVETAESMKGEAKVMTEGEVKAGDEPRNEESGGVTVNQEAKDAINNSRLEFVKDGFKDTELRISQFSRNEKALADLITCALGV